MKVDSRASALTAAAFLAIGLIAFAPILHVGFMGDDWMFMDVVSRARNALVTFAVLNQRYTRPLVVLVYYLNFRHFGVWPFPAHLVVVLLHVYNAWLVSVLAARLMPRPNRLAATGAGLIFLLFAGHSEAVSWVAGMADAAIVPFLIGGLLFFDRALASARPARWLVLAWLLGAAGLLAKETAMLLPALALAWGVVPIRDRPMRQRLTRTAVFVAGAALICAGYWLFRQARFGSALGAYAGMGTSEGQRLAIARIFFLRTLVPPGRIAAAMWVHYLDLALLAAIAAGAGTLAWIDRRTRAGLMFLVMALVIALAPALPLSISLVNTLTERYVYLATVFSCALVAWLAAGLVRPRALAAVLIVCIAGMQWRYLAHSNQSWIQGDQVFSSAVTGLAGLARARDPLGHSTILLLNLPDTIDRPHVDGAGVVTALRLMPGGLPEPDGRVHVVAMQQSLDGLADVRVTRAGPRVTVDLGQDIFVDGWTVDTPDYALASHAAHGFAVDLKPSPRRLLVAYTAQREVRLAAEIDGLPFGYVDLPADNAVCEGTAMSVAGWALDDQPGVEVAIEREAAGTWSALGAGAWRTGTRPDVTALYPRYPEAARAEWSYQLPCATVKSSGGEIRIRAVARDRAGQQTTLGDRTVRTR